MLEDGVLRRWVFGPPTRKKPPRRTERGCVGGGIASRIPPEREVRIIRLQVHYSIYLPVESSEFRSANYLVRRLIPRKVVRFAIFFFGRTHSRRGEGTTMFVHTRIYYGYRIGCDIFSSIRRGGRSGRWIRWRLCRRRRGPHTNTILDRTDGVGQTVHILRWYECKK